MSNPFIDFLKKDYEDCIETVADISKNIKNTSMVNDNKIKLFNFDKIVAKFFRNNTKPSSADALYIENNTLTFIEFKGGFNDTNKNASHGTNTVCKNNNDCKYYIKLYSKNKKKEKEILKLNLKCKIVETFIFYKYELLYKYNEETKNNNNFIINFLIVINDPVEEYENILLDSSSKDHKGNKQINNDFQDIKNMIKKFKNKKQYYYKNIDVCGTTAFTTKIKKYISL